MARKVFFSFHYERDAWRVGQVRNCNVVSDEDRFGFIDAADWESIKRNGKSAIERWIDEQLKNTSVTAVLIGAETADREWVKREIEKSWNRGNGIVGIWIHNIKDQDQKTDVKGDNPFQHFAFPGGTNLASVCKTYDWVLNEGRKNLGMWAEEAAQIRAEYGQGDKISEPLDGKVAEKQGTSAAYASVSFAPRSPWSCDDVECN